jgi:class 3 adenylate cyclase
LLERLGFLPSRHSRSGQCQPDRHRQISYDIWGDSKNVASRLESNGVPGSGPVSDGVFKRLNGRFKERGE